jgi:hypothetical protein
VAILDQPLLLIAQVVQPRVGLVVDGDRLDLLVDLGQLGDHAVAQLLDVLHALRRDQQDLARGLGELDRVERALPEADHPRRPPGERDQVERELRPRVDVVLVLERALRGLLLEVHQGLRRVPDERDREPRGLETGNDEHHGGREVDREVDRRVEHVRLDVLADRVGDLAELDERRRRLLLLLVPPLERDRERAVGVGLGVLDEHLLVRALGGLVLDLVAVVLGLVDLRDVVEHDLVAAVGRPRLQAHEVQRCRGGLLAAAHVDAGARDEARPLRLLGDLVAPLPQRLEVVLSPVEHGLGRRDRLDLVGLVQLVDAVDLGVDRLHPVPERPRLELGIELAAGDRPLFVVGDRARDAADVEVVLGRLGVLVRGEAGQRRLLLERRLVGLRQHLHVDLEGGRQEEAVVDQRLDRVRARLGERHLEQLVVDRPLAA